jgi:hypothetical protein
MNRYRLVALEKESTPDAAWSICAFALPSNGTMVASRQPSEFRHHASAVNAEATAVRG